MMVYPAFYTAIGEEEMTYLDGGITVAGTKNFIKLMFTHPFQAIKKFNEKTAGVRSKTAKAKSFFNWVIGDYMFSEVMGDVRDDLWASAKAGNLDAFDNRMKTFDEMSTPGQLLYIYGAYRIGEKVVSYF